LIVAGVIIYFLLKFFLYLYRPFYLQKILRRIEEKYKQVLTHTEKRLDEAIEELNEWQSDDKHSFPADTKEEALESVNNAKLNKAHEEEMYSKFLRLRERFIHNYSKLWELIIIYQRYLDFRLTHIQDAEIFALGVSSGVVSDDLFNDMIAIRNETLIILEESERKLDKLLE
jgi:hypothetical protein